MKGIVSLLLACMMYVGTASAEQLEIGGVYGAWYVRCLIDDGKEDCHAHAVRGILENGKLPPVRILPYLRATSDGSAILQIRFNRPNADFKPDSSRSILLTVDGDRIASLQFKDENCSEEECVIEWCPETIPLMYLASGEELEIAFPITDSNFSFFGRTFFLDGFDYVYLAVADPTKRSQFIKLLQFKQQEAQQKQ